MGDKDGDAQRIAREFTSEQTGKAARTSGVALFRPARKKPARAARAAGWKAMMTVEAVQTLAGLAQATVAGRATVI